MTTTTKSIKALHESIIEKLHNGEYADGTYNINTMAAVEFSKGYQVTFWETGMIHSDDDYEFLHAMFTEASMDGETYIGYFDGYAEISYRIKDKETAIRLAKMFNQVCIWDWKHCECIATNGTGKA